MEGGREGGEGGRGVKIGREERKEGCQCNNAAIGERDEALVKTETSDPQ